MSICSTEPRDMTSTAGQSSGKCLAQTCRPTRRSPLLTRQKSPGKTARNFSVRDQVFGVYRQLCYRYRKKHLACFFLGHICLIWCYCGRVAQLVEQVTFNHFIGHLFCSHRPFIIVLLILSVFEVSELSIGNQ